MAMGQPQHIDSDPRAEPGNVNWENFLNYTLMAIPKEEYIPSMEDLCGDYLAKWGRD